MNLVPKERGKCACFQDLCRTDQAFCLPGHIISFQMIVFSQLVQSIECTVQEVLAGVQTREASSPMTMADATVLQATSWSAWSGRCWLHLESNFHARHAAPGPYLSLDPQQSQSLWIMQEVLAGVQTGEAGSPMTMADATRFADNALEHMVRTLLAALTAPAILESTQGALRWDGLQYEKRYRRLLSPPLQRLLTQPGALQPQALLVLISGC